MKERLLVEDLEIKILAGAKYSKKKKSEVRKEEKSEKEQVLVTEMSNGDLIDGDWVVV